MGCLFAMLAVFAPRLALFFLWVFTPIVNAVFNSWFWPLLGIIFAPFTTLMYVFVVAPLGPTNFWGWLCIILAVLVDARNWYDVYHNRSATAAVFPAAGATQ